MPIQGHRQNPFQLPQFSQKLPVQHQQNPFRPTPTFGGNPGGSQPPGDAFSLFKTQIENKQIQPDLNRPKPHTGAGQRLFAMG